MGWPPVPRVRRVPLNWCEVHHHLGIWREDGTARWACDECLADALYRAEVLSEHDAGRCERFAFCPFCEPEGKA